MKPARFIFLIIAVTLETVVLPFTGYSQISDNYFIDCQAWEAYFEANPSLKDQEDGGYSRYLRWKEFWRTRVYNSNSSERGKYAVYETAMNQFFLDREYYSRSTNIYSDWRLLGPKLSSIQNMGEISAIYIDTISDKTMKTIYAGTNSSGIWRTVDGGSNWQNLTDGSNFFINGITDITGDPANSDVIYATTGGGFMNDHSYSSGIIKTINAGQTWDLFYPLPISEKHTVSGILIDPDNPDHIFALVDTTVQRTLDGGQKWEPVLRIPRIGPPINEEKRFCMNVVMKPGDINTLFIATGNHHWANSHQQEIWKISNALDPDTGAVIRERLDTLLPNNGRVIHCERFNVAVTPANPDALFAACNDWVTDTIIINFDTSIITTERLKIWKFDNGIWTREIDSTVFVNGVGYFKFEFMVSPTDQNVLYVGGLTMQRLVKTGNIWQRLAYTEGIQGHPTYHFDTRDAKILRGSTPGTSGQNDILFAGNDGGISKTVNGITDWTNLNGNGLAITQFWGIGGANSIPQKIACGSQDNSYFEYNSGQWSSHENGDFGNIVVDYQSPQYMYASIWGSGVTGLVKSENGGTNWTGVPADTAIRSEKRMLCTPIVLNPLNPKTVFFGAENLYKSHERLNAPLIKIPVPQAECDTCSRNEISAFTISPQDTSIMYLVVGGIAWGQPKKFFKTSNYGLTWQNLTDNVTIKGVRIFDNYIASDIAICPTDANKIWITLTGFYSSQGDSSRVIFSANGGISFTNYSKGLPNMPVNCIRYINGSNDQLLVGTDVGIYYIDNSLSEWQPFNIGLPVCVVNDIEINDTEKKVRAGTFGRGLWETAIDCNFNADDPLVIQRNTTWANDTVLDNSVYIDSSFTLTIHGRVLFPPMAKIFVKQGGKLIVDGGTLTNKCLNQWQGIEVWGRYDLPQYPAYQGVTIFKNRALVENARIGVTTCKKDANGAFEWTTTGGIIKAENATFRNNYKAAEFVMNKKGQVSSFKNVIFETTPDFVEGAVFSDFVSLIGVRGVQFLGCTFRNSTSNTDSIPGATAGRGIYSLGSSFLVDQYEFCPSSVVPCPDLQYFPSRFQGLRYGIRALGFEPTYSITVNRTQFDNNYRGVYLGSINNAVVTRDTFNLRTFYSNSDTLYGLYLGKSTGYKIQENRFHCGGNAMITNNHISLPQREFGVVVDSSGAAPNEIYKNYFDSLDVAINAQKLNRSPGDSTGLVIKCNTYANNSYDEMITYDISGSAEGIALKQGAKTGDPADPTGNTFSPYHGSISPANAAGL